MQIEEKNISGIISLFSIKKAFYNETKPKNIYSKPDKFPYKRYS